MIYLAISALMGFIATFAGTPYARRYLKSSGIYGVDQQKQDKPKLPTSGGIAVFFGTLVAITSYMGFVAFLGASSTDIPMLLAALGSINIITLIGLIDDIHVSDGDSPESGSLPTDRVWEKVVGLFGEVSREGEVHRRGISQMPKMLFVLPAALPLIAVGAGSWTMNFPVLGTVNWGVLYPLVLLPVGLLFVSNVVNMLAGTNGLSSAMSFVAAMGLGTFAVINGAAAAAVIAFGLAASLLGFLFYNFYPASILPGDSLTYLSGAALFSAIVIGNMEKFGVFIFTPWFLEFFLKLRSGFKAHSWGELQEDGSLKPLYDKNYSLTHPLMRRGYTEKQVTLMLAGFETLICVLGLVVFTAVI
ncbi:MAG: hypothetical protein ABEJ69_00420 [Candidatus Nanohaloarchaea archaeon]